MTYELQLKLRDLLYTNLKARFEKKHILALEASATLIDTREQCCAVKSG